MVMKQIFSEMGKENGHCRLEFCGTGTSLGVPVIGCGCEVCRSSDPKDKRLRSSVLVDYEGLRILVDAGPDFRAQMLRSGVTHIDAILLTHNHKDHTGGLDDVRALNYNDGRPIEIWCEEYVEESLRKEYSYAFAAQKYPGVPEWNIHHIGGEKCEPFELCADGRLPRLAWTDTGYAKVPGDPNAVPRYAKIVPIRGMHAKLPVLGFRFGKIAYCTDMNYIPEEEFEKLHGLEHFIINTVKRGKHISHWGLEEALAVCERVGAKHSWLTHLSHRLPCYDDFVKELNEKYHGTIQPAYDGLVIECD